MKPFRQKLRDRDLLIGTWFTTPSIYVADIISKSGLDFFILDREHGPLSIETTLELCAVAQGNGVGSIVRCSHNGESEVLRCLDTGATGIQAPNIESCHDARQLVDFSLYPPEGSRGFSLYTRNGRYGDIDAKESQRRTNSEVAIIINIESIDAVDKIDEILEIDRVDGVFIGLYDLSKSLGCTGDFKSIEVRDALKRVVAAANQHKRSVGTICKDSEIAQHYVSLGMNYIVYSVDNNVIRTAYKDFVSDIREI